jgi:hypothetical protein
LLASIYDRLVIVTPTQLGRNVAYGPFGVYWRLYRARVEIVVAAYRRFAARVARERLHR